MPDMISNSITGLLSYQSALATTSHNIANAQTEGYSRQRVDIMARTPQAFGNGYFGTGSQVTNVRRIYDGYLAQQAQSTASSFNYLDAYYGMAVRIDNLLADPTAGLMPGLESFFGAVQDLADDPASIPARYALLGNAEELANRFDYLNERLGSLDREVNAKLKEMTVEVSSLASSIAEANRQIVELGAGTGAAPNDLLDRRDVLIQQLSELISVTTLPQDDGAVNVFIGNGQSMVIGGQSFRLDIAQSPKDPSYQNVVYLSSNGPLDITDNLSGGSLGGVLQFRDEMLETAKSNLGRIAVTLSETFNEQHMKGMDLNFEMGEAFFTAGDPIVINNRDNTGLAEISASVTDVSQLTTSDYQVYRDKGNWYVTRLSDNTTQRVNMPIVIDGVEFSVANASAAVDGDAFLVRPTSGASNTFGVLIDDVRKIAAAAPILAEKSQENLGNGVITPGVMVDPTAYIRDNYTVLAAAGSNATLAAQPALQLNGALHPNDTLLTLPAGTTVTDYDGVTHDIAVSYSNTGANNEWLVTVSLEANPVAANPLSSKALLVRFDENGELDTIDGIPAWEMVGGVKSYNRVVTLDAFTDASGLSNALEVDLSGLRQLPANSPIASTVNAAATSAPAYPASFVYPVPGVLDDVNANNNLDYTLTINNVTIFTQTEADPPVTSLEVLRDRINTAMASVDPQVNAYLDNGQLLLAYTSPTGSPITISETVTDTTSGNPVEAVDQMRGYFGSNLAYDAATQTLGSTLTITADSNPSNADSYVVLDGSGSAIASGPYNSGNEILFRGLSIEISGDPNTGDIFTVSPNDNGVGDNRNMLLLGALQDAQLLDNGHASYQDGYSEMVAEIGTITRRTEINRAAQETMHTQAMQAKEAVSGVNLDEEAANLMRYQQAYQAAAQVVGVANSLFDTLLGAVGR